MKRSLSTICLRGALALSLLSMTACEPPNWEDPAYVSKQLIEGDAPQRRIALERLGQLKDEDKVKTVPGLVAVYNAAGPNQRDAMTQLVQLRDAGAKDVYLAELKSNTTGYAGASAKALGEIGAKEALPDMMKLLESSDDNDVKLDILAAFQEMPDPSVLPALKKVMALDVDNFPIALHAYACETIGEIALAAPQGIDDETVQIVTRAVFFANNLNQNLDTACGLAIQRMGPRVTPELVKIFKGERDDVQKLMMKYDVPGKSPFPQNHPQLIAAKRLASLRAKEGVDTLVADLGEKKVAPKELSGQAAVDWRVKEGQSASETIYALGDIGDARAYDVLEAILTNKVADDWDDITDGMVEIQLRQDAASALNRLGDRRALEPLLKMAEEGVVIDFEKRWAILEGRGEKVSAIQRYQFNWMVAAEYANLASGDKLEEFKGLVTRTSEKYPELGTKLGEYVTVIEVAAECDAKGDDAAKASCYGEKLKDPKPEIRAKAAWELGRLPAAAAAPVLNANLGTDFLDTREIITFNLYRMPSKETMAAIEKLLVDEKNKTSAGYKLDHFRQKLLYAYLKHSLK